MAKVSLHQKTLEFLLERGDEGATLDDILSTGIHRATFYRHRLKINDSSGYFIESFKNDNGTVCYRIRNVDSRIRTGHSWRDEPKVIDSNNQDEVLMGIEPNFSEFPAFDRYYLDSKKWRVLKWSLSNAHPIVIKKYDCPIWEKYPTREFIVFPKSVFIYHERYYLYGVWINGKTDVFVYLSLDGIAKYSQLKPIAENYDIAKAKPCRWTGVWVGIRNLSRRIKSETWHPEQIDFDSAVSIADYGKEWTMQTAEKALKSYSFLRYLPKVNEITMMKIYSWNDDVAILK